MSEKARGNVRGEKEGEEPAEERPPIQGPVISPDVLISTSSELEHLTFKKGSVPIYQQPFRSSE